MRPLLELSAAVFLSALFVSTGYGQQPPAGVIPPAPSPPLNASTGGNIPGAALFGFFSSKTPYEFWLTCLVVVFGLIVLLVLFIGARTLPSDHRSDDFSRTVIVITVVSASLLLISAGFSDRQSAPAFGLLGTIVGYVLGRMGQQRTGITGGEPGAGNDQVPSPPHAGDGRPPGAGNDQVPSPPHAGDGRPPNT